MLYEENMPPVREFADTEAAILKEIGRASVRENYAFDQKPIVITCRTAGINEGPHGKLEVDVGYFEEKEIETKVKLPAKAKAAAGEEYDASVEYHVCLRAFGKVQKFDESFGQYRAMEFACELALAAYGPNLNYMADLQAQRPPTLSQTRDVLIKYGLADEATLPPRRVRKVASHGGRGQNAMAPDEYESLTGIKG